MANEDVFRLCTWNIQWGRGRDGRVDLGRTAGMLLATNADVICLQEVAVNHPGLPGNPAGNQSILLAGALPGYEAVFAAGSDLTDGQGGRRQFGQLVLSRVPVLQVFRHCLPWLADPAVPSMQRVALEAVLAAPFGPLRVITTHLEFYSRRQREAQVEALRAIHAEGWRHAHLGRSAADADPPFAVLPRGGATILCGDFNFPPGSPEYRRLQEAFAAPEADTPRLRDAWASVRPQEPHAPTTGIAATEFVPSPACFDFFFVSENLVGNLDGISVDAACEASDHQPVILELDANNGKKVIKVEGN